MQAMHFIAAKQKKTGKIHLYRVTERFGRVIVGGLAEGARSLIFVDGISKNGTIGEGGKPDPEDSFSIVMDTMNERPDFVATLEVADPGKRLEMIEAELTRRSRQAREAGEAGFPIVTPIGGEDRS